MCRLVFLLYFDSHQRDSMASEEAFTTLDDDSESNGDEGGDDVLPVVSSDPMMTHQENFEAPEQAATAATSHVNGIGLWKAWGRSFRQPIDAFLDILDNAVDAIEANRFGRGKVRIDTIPVSGGVSILNSFPESKYKEMHAMLDVYSSQKQNDEIGENGVGVKQASASLSDFTLVITRKRARFQVGVLASSLQTEEGVRIPSYTFEEGCNLKEEILRLSESDVVFRQSMIHFGGFEARLGTNLSMEEWENSFLLKGQHRLEETFLDLVNEHGEWASDHCVYGLYLDQLRFDDASILAELRDTLPHKYIHLSEDHCDILIGGKRPIFQYWERRLVELTCFEFQVSNIHDFKSDNVNDPRNASTLRLFIGFDHIRCSSFNQQSTGALYIYSRESGRLIKHLSDCRTELSLPAGSSDYSQGLTIILDDYQSSLPLTPTKQDIAYSDGPNGDVHRANVYAWMSGIVEAYYNHYLTLFEGSKHDITRQVKRHNCRKAISGPVTPLREAHFFNKFDLPPAAWKTRKGKIVLGKKIVSIDRGDATLMKFELADADIIPEQQGSMKRSISEIGDYIQGADELGYRPQQFRRGSTSRRGSMKAADQRRVLKLTQENKELKEQLEKAKHEKAQYVNETVAKIKDEHQREMAEKDREIRRLQSNGGQDTIAELSAKDATIRELNAKYEQLKQMATRQICKTRTAIEACQAQIRQLKHENERYRQQNQQLGQQLDQLRAEQQQSSTDLDLSSFTMFPATIHRAAKS